VVGAGGVLLLAIALNPAKIYAAFNRRPDLQMASEATEQPSAELEAEAAESQTTPGLRLWSIGKFRLEADGRDVTSELLARPTLAFIWMLLLARWVRSADDRILRTALAEELAPGLPSQTQSERLRDYLHDLQHKLPAELIATVDVDRKTVGLRLLGIASDVEELRRLEPLGGTRGQHLDPKMAAKIQRLLAAFGTGEFLPGFEELEHKVTGSRGVAENTVTDARALINRGRGNLAAVLADHYLAVGNPEKAIPELEKTLQLDAGREDLARLLVQVHLRCGHTATAAAVTEQYGLAAEV
jgi:hypothetical protein